MPRFLVLAGKHTSGKKVDGTYKVYVRGDTVDVPDDKPVPAAFKDGNKFRLVSGTVPADKAPQRKAPCLEDKGIDELRQFCEENEVPVDDPDDKAGIIAAIREHQKGE